MKTERNPTSLRPLPESLAPTGNSKLIPELLAPAGSREAFFAALATGADAIYLGTNVFNARRNAENFTLADLKALCDIAHLAGRRLYLTLNIAILNSEFKEALELARQAWAAGIDAAIVHDLGLMRAIARAIPGLRIHASTQLNAHSAADLTALASLGVSRVTLARELSLAEVTELTAHASTIGIETEVFAHGALCFCYSGQCLMSSLIGRRSANRGLCAQPCRLPWKLIDTSTGRAVNTPGEHLLSTGDLCSLPLLDGLAASGTASLKIEGRMKSASYVATVVKAYRAALDQLAAKGATLGAVGDDAKAVDDDATKAAAADDATKAATELDKTDAQSQNGAQEVVPPELDEVFSRTLTTAYLGKDRSNTMMSFQRPNNRGALVGRIATSSGGFTGIELSRAVEQGDILEVWTSKGNKALPLERFFGSIGTSAGKPPKPLSSATAGSTIYLEIEGGAGKGDRVFRIRNNALEEEAQAYLESSLFAGNNGLVPVTFDVEIRLGQPLRISATAGGVGESGCGRTINDSITATAFGPIVEVARTKALTIADVTEHVSRVGTTPFTVSECTVSLDEGAGAGFSVLHATRAAALEKLSEMLLAPWHQRRLAATPARIIPAPARRGIAQLAVLVRDSNGARAARKAGAKLIYGHVTELDPTDDAIDFSRGTIHPWLPNIAHSRDYPSLEKPSVAGQPLVVNTLGELVYSLSRNASVETGPSIPVYNHETLALLAEKKVQRVWLGPELSYTDLETLTPESPVPLGITVSGYQELMVSEHCILMAQGPCAQDCAHCTRRKAPRLLEDRKGYRFPVRTDSRGRGHLYNAVPLDLFAEIPRLLSCGITGFLVDATMLTTNEITLEVERGLRAVDLAVRGVGSLPKREGYTTGHLYRGLL